VETKKAFSQVDKGDLKKLEVSFVGLMVKDDQGEQYFGFWEHELGKLWPILEQAELIIGFNIKEFDFKVLAPYYSGDLAKLPVLDILEEFTKQAGHRISLNSLARASLATEKNGTGMQAIDLFAQGKLDQLKKYCLKDVKITYQIYQYIRKFGFIKFINKWNNIKQVKIDFSSKLDQAKVQMTLG